MEQHIANSQSFGLQNLRNSLGRRTAAAALGVVTLVGVLSACGGPEDEPQTTATTLTPTESADPTPTATPTPEVTPETPAVTGDLPAPNSELAASPDEILSNLARLESDAGVGLFDNAMRFFGMPSTTGKPYDHGWHPDALRYGMSAGVESLIVFEPAPQADVSLLASTSEDQVVTEYFDYLKQSGIDAETLGTVVIMPELIVGGWQGADAGNYASIVNHQAMLLHQSFPDAKTTSMIDLQPVESAVLIPELSSIETGTLSSIGVQGFSNRREILFTTDSAGKLLAGVESYLDPTLIVHASQQAGNIPVWINTGIPEQDNGVQYGVEQRVAIAEGILRVIGDIQAQGVQVDFLNLFAQDKTQAENINFDFTPDAAKAVLPVLSQGLRDRGVALSGFSATPA